MKTKEELLKRALTTTNFADFIYEDLSDLITHLTPMDVPLFSRLARGVATQSTHEWNERSLSTSFSGTKYSGETALPGASTNSGSPRSNKVMQIGVEAVASEFLNAMNTIGDGRGLDAFALELEEKMQNLMRSIEYWAWNGDSAAGGAQETDGIIKSSAGFTTVSNAGSAAALVELKLNELISAQYTAGGSPTHIFARPLVCQRIANFNTDKIRFMPGGGEGGVAQGAFSYLSPFGYTMQIVPVRGDFLPSGSVYVLDMSKIKMCFMGGQEIMMKDLPITNDDVSRKLLKSYMALETRALTYHGKLRKCGRCPKLKTSKVLEKALRGLFFLS